MYQINTVCWVEGAIDTKLKERWYSLVRSNKIEKKVLDGGIMWDLEIKKDSVAQN